MLEEIDYSEFLEDEKNCVLVDVRSRAEYEDHHIPGSLNIELLNDEDRKYVGFLYDHVDCNLAKLEGVKRVSSRLCDIFEKFQRLNRDYRNIVIYCKRGGFRSGSLCALLRSLRLHVSRIRGGYKAYRAFMTEDMNKRLDDIKLISIYGMTGTGKTRILRRLREDGFAVLDLEKYASHRGSVLGEIKDGQNSQKMFESLIYEEIRKSDKKIFFTEGESRRIGNVIIPEKLFSKMANEKRILVNLPLNERIRIIKEDYVDNEDSENIVKKIMKLKGLISDERLNRYLSFSADKDYDSIIEDLLITRYDGMYAFSRKNFDMRIEKNSFEELYNEIKNVAKEA